VVARSATFLGPAPDASNYAFKIARVLSSGSLDSTFGVKGIVTATFRGGTTTEAEFNVARAVIYLPPGKLIVAGHSVLVPIEGNPTATQDVAIARYPDE